MNRRIAVALGVLALAALTACTTPVEDPKTPTPNPPVESAQEQPAGADDFLAALAGIDPSLAAGGEDAVTAAENVCTYVSADETEAVQLKAVTDRFEGVSEADAPAVLAAIKEHVC